MSCGTGKTEFTSTVGGSGEAAPDVDTKNAKKRSKCLCCFAREIK